MILAFELSTRRGSIALCDGEKTLAQRAWDDPAARHATLWPALQDLVKETQLNWPTLKALAVGRGPGSFSGLRAAITTARVLAAPDLHPVVAVSSGEALATDWFHQHAAHTNSVVVAGDARRGAIWFAVFHRHGEKIKQTTEWSLAPAADFAARIPRDANVLTSDRIRLTAALGRAVNGVTCTPGDHFPSAETVALMAQVRLATNWPGEPLEPLYLHPATTP